MWVGERHSRIRALRHRHREQRRSQAEAEAPKSREGQFTPISPGQCRAARALLDWSQEQMAEASGLSLMAIRNFESGAVKPRRSTYAMILAAAAQHGIAFVEEDGTLGVSLRKDFATPSAAHHAR
jgi:DNA-binding XRE family transcriptional regulator